MNELHSTDYRHWLKSLKSHIQSAQQRAALAANQELICLYWQIGNKFCYAGNNKAGGVKSSTDLRRIYAKRFPK